MEFRSITLTPHPQLYWVGQLLYSLRLLGITLFLGLMLAISIQYYLFSTQAEMSQQQEKLTELMHTNRTLIRQIEQQKQQVSVKKQNETINKNQLAKQLFLLKNLPLSAGGLEIIAIDPKQTKLVGKSVTQNDFEQLERYLNQQKIHYQLVHFQSDEKQKNEFILNFSQEN